MINPTLERVPCRISLRGRPRRQALSLALYDLMTRLVFETCDWRKTLFQTLLEARSLHGDRRPIVEDMRRQDMTYDRLIAGSLGLGRRLARLSQRGERVGLLLPNAVGAAVAFFALQAVARVPALLNFSTGFAGMSAACKAAELKLILTSREFLAAARLEETAAKLGEQAKLVYLEDIAAAIGPFARLGALLSGQLARFRPPRQPASSAPAVVLFTSGSEGAPKGVVLSHENLLANRYQMGALVDFNPTDIVFNAMPIFHSFGLTGGLLLPLLAGVKTFLYPSPLHYRIVPLLAYDSNATILFGTDTFLAGYARAANSYDFYSVRYVFAGAERVREETRQAFANRFGLRILEGYGATETAPVIAVNTPMQYKPGTVGRFVPGLTCRLEPIDGVAKGRRLLLSGPNVMLGYLTVDRPGELQPPPDGIYDTGDIVTIDAQGFVTLKGRVKRFAKIAGEMVSLAAVEETALKLWPGHQFAAVAIPDPRKGEQLVLVTDHASAKREELQAHARALGLPELSLPRLLLAVERMPLLGSGKLDYPAIGALAERAAVTLTA